MPIICIGPVCIPITAIIPVLLFIFKPIYDRLPKEYQEKIDYGIKKVQLAMNRCWKRIWPTKQEKESEVSVTATNKKCDAAIIKKIANEDEWDALIEQSKNENLVFIAYFTSKWCKPCKEIYPFFEELCQTSTSGMKYVKLDIDELDEISLEYKVTALPTFIKFTAGKPTETVQGPKRDQLKAMFND